MSYDLGTAHGKIEIDYTGDKDVDRAEKDMKSLSGGSKDTDKEMSKLGATLKKVFSGLGGAAKFGALGIAMVQAGAAAGNLIVQLLGMVPALTSIASLSAALPGLFVGMAASTLVLKSAFKGMDKVVAAAFDPAKAKDFDKAIKNLAPSAQAFAKSLKEFAPALTGIQKGIQQAFFQSNFQDLFPAVGAALGKLRPELEGLASQFGDIGRQIITFGTNSDTVGFVTQAIQAFRSALEDVTPSLDLILPGLVAVGRVGLPLINDLSSGVGNLAVKFGDFLQGIASDGRLQAWIDTALDTLSQLGTIASNVGTIFSTLFGLAAGTGANFLSTLELLTTQVATFVKSAEGQQAITALFQGLATVAGQLGPIITVLAGALASALGPAISTIATGIGPVLLDVVQKLAPAFGPLATAIADLVTAIAPLLPPLAQLIGLLAGQLGTAVSALAGEFGPLINIFGTALSAALTAITPLFTAFNANLPLTAALGAQLGQAFSQLLPSLTQFATTIAGALIPVLPQLVAAFAQLLPIMVDLANAFVLLFNSGLQVIIPVLPTLISAFVGIATAGVNVVSGILKMITVFVQFGALLASALVGLRAFAAGLLGSITGGITSAYNAVVSVGGTIIAWFAALPGRVFSAIASFVSNFPTIMSTAVNNAAFAVGAAIGTIISFFANLPGRAFAAASSLNSRIVGLVTSVMNTARNLVNGGINAVVGFFGNLPGRASGAASSLPGVISSIAREAMSRLRSAISSGISSAISLLRALPSRARSAVGNLGGALVSAGRDLVLGLARGISGAVGAAVSAAVSVGKQVVSGIKSTLHINSPSRVMVEVGEDTGEGLVVGLKNMLHAVGRAASNLAQSVVAPTIGLAAAAPTTDASRGVAAPTGPQPTTSQFTQNVYALPGMSAHQVASFAFSRLRIASAAGVGAVANPAEDKGFTH